MSEKIAGLKVTLRPATPVDRRPIYDWLANSDITKLMLGPPTYPDIPVPTWEEFIEDYRNYFFDSSEPLLGRCFVIEVNSDPIGQINHDKISQTDHSTELDIWLRSSQCINKGYGTDAINTLCNYLAQEFDCRKFVLAPSKRNTAAIRAYEKAGFVETNMKVPESESDYSDMVVMVRFVNN
jgi:diamine N-acetyltransferase